MAAVVSIAPGTGKFIAATAEQKFQLKVMNLMKILGDLPKTEVVIQRTEEEISTIYIRSSLEYAPDFKLSYCSRKNHYRVYILVGCTDYEKKIAGYSICVLNSAFAAMTFAGLVKFLHSNRAGNRTQAN